ncbi:hypothetical protein ZWY2020_054575 [Hordeum vulgare]|nr:hypothetical protein ZWY2020_054575 [Hordeum vulgare]
MASSRKDRRDAICPLREAHRRPAHEDGRRRDWSPGRCSPGHRSAEQSGVPALAKRKKKPKKKKASGATPGVSCCSASVGAELAAYIGDFRDSDFTWEVTETAPLVFSVPFPSAELLRVCSHDFIRCPTNKFLISVHAATAGPELVPPLEKVWVLVYGLPRGGPGAPRGGKLMHILKVISEPVGKLVTADLASLEDDGPARIEILCPAPTEIDGLSLIFYFGYTGRCLTFEIQSPAMPGWLHGWRLGLGPRSSPGLVLSSPVWWSWTGWRSWVALPLSLPQLLTCTSRRGTC